MLGHHLKIIGRGIIRQKGYSFINIAGLAVGMACCLLITLWIMDVLSYDKFHANAGNLRMILTQGSVKDNPATPAPLAPALADRFPEIHLATRYDQFYSGLFSYENAEFQESGIAAVDPSFLEMFTFPLVKGDSRSALTDQNSIVISEATAQEYFANADPMGKVLTMDHSRKFTVAGVFTDVPRNSSLQFDMLVPFEVQMIEAKKRTGWDMGWEWNRPLTFLMIRDGCALDDLHRKISEFYRMRIEEEKHALSTIPFTDRVLFFSGIGKYIVIFS
ncbi:MAG: ABC transporter permease, partial [Candidatus Zixiibacteriota bacterium]